MANKINQYIIDKGFKAPKETDKTGKVPVRNSYRNGKGRPEGVVVHETANPTSTIGGEISYMQGHYKDAFVHEFVDGQNIIGVADTDYLAWGAGYTANSRYIQFEQVRVHSKDDFAKELLNGATFVANVLKKYNLKPNDSTIVTHHQTSNMFHETDHTDPDAYWTASASKWFSTTYKIADFIWLVKYIFDGKAPSKPATPSKPVTPSKPKPAKKIAEDGEGGVATIKLAQKIAGTTQDGVITGQYAPNTKYWTKIHQMNTRYANGGSLFVVTLQKKLGFKGKDLDGQWGKKVSTALNSKLGFKNKSAFDKTSVLAWQKKLNSGKLF